MGPTNRWNKLEELFVVETKKRVDSVGKIWRIVGSFAAMYVVATILGFATYLLISPAAMWISIFTLMPAVSAWLIYLYLRKMRFAPEASLAEYANLLLVWICL